MDRRSVEKEITKGGAWLGAARTWMQTNVVRGDLLSWSSPETIHLPFYKLQELAQAVAIATTLDVVSSKMSRSPKYVNGNRVISYCDCHKNEFAKIILNAATHNNGFTYYYVVQFEKSGEITYLAEHEMELA